MSYIGIKDFPSKKCFKKLKKDIKYDEVISAIKDNKSRNVEEWVESLKGYLSSYLSNNADEWNDSYRYKCCNDLNYILDVIIEEVLQSKLEKNIWLYNRIETYTMEILKRFNSLKCYRDLYDKFFRFRHLKKKFFDFCEDSSYVSSNFEQIKNGNKCRVVMFDIRKRRDDIARILNKNRRIPRELFNFSDNCNGYNIEKIHKTTNCMKVTHAERLPSSAPLGEGADDLDLSASADDPEVLDPDSSEASDLVEREIQEYESSEHLNIAYAVSSVFGTGLFSYFLYRATPVGSWIRSKVLSNTQNDFSMLNDESDNSLLNNIDPLQLNMDNYAYNMPYAAG
ncbi:PIR Superfamily Protein [Plasmodium ovale wallikeri]|uniref:PIR Superfamily Protein n=2 Tax=Plasmodium ovale TaxID=36330 RepID=A0A1A9ATS2_PLAOA|nr:PIR Superfamily Protein [Plasmodium ovale wallikeri]SBT59574.1 PIR Superfamily Protein [Plasmodium ovale wallikeri]SBT73897.1 PIR protein [Plasmodium ovale]